MNRLRSLPALAATAALLGAPFRALGAHAGDATPPTGLDPLLLGGLVAAGATAVVSIAVTLAGGRRRAPAAGDPAVDGDRGSRGGDRGSAPRRTQVHLADDPIVAAIGLPGGDADRPTTARRSRARRDG